MRTIFPFGLPKRPPAILLRLALTTTVSTGLSLLASPAFAAPGTPVGQSPEDPYIEGSPLGTGVGLALGQPSGITWAVRPDRKQAWQGVFGWSFPQSRLSLSGDYTRTLADLSSGSTPDLRYPLYAGLGLALNMAPASSTGSDLTLAVRVPLGLLLQPTRIRVDVYLEAAPGLAIIPAPAFHIEAAIGFRYYFGPKATQIAEDE